MSFHPAPRENKHQPETSDGETALTGFIGPKKEENVICRRHRPRLRVIEKRFK
jgi:hypothetical protein